MRSIKILTPLSTLPNVTSVTTLFFKNFLPVLKSKINTTFIWIIYTPETINLSEQKSGEKILDIHNYKNALDMIQNVKPDIIFAGANANLIDYSFSLAGKYLNIPVVSGFFGTRETTFKFNKFKLYSSYIKRFFQSTTPTDTSASKKRLMKRGRFFIYKYFFLLRTLRAMHYGFSEIFKNFLMLINVYLSYTDFIVDSRFATTLHWLDGEYHLKSLIEAGFDKSSIIITGSPMYDEVFKKLKKFRAQEKVHGKIRVLFLTAALYEHGLWTKSKRDSTVSNIVKEICKHKDGISLVIKIHPSAELLSEYNSLTQSIDPSVSVYQKGDVLDFLNGADVVVGFETNTSIEYALFCRKPIVICNFDDRKGDDLLERGLAFECKEISNLVPTIFKANRKNPASEKKIDDYKKFYFYKSDGLASERLAEAILKLVNRK